jgi:GT2 family glycosyltransferase
VISACIVNWNTRDHLRRCLQSLRESRVEGELQVIVVDNASSDGSADMVREEFSEVELIANADNRYYAAGNNQGLARARGEYVALLNPDVALPPDGLQRMCAFLAATDDAAAVAPRLILPDGSVQRSVRGFPGPWEVFCEATLLSRAFPRSRRFARYWLPDFHYDEVRAVPQPMASCFVLKAGDLARLGGFDEDFAMFFNDVDLCYRLAGAGRRVYFLPEVEVAHHHGASTSQVRREMVRASNEGLLRFYAKHYRGKVCWPAYAATVLLLRVAGLAKWLLAPSPRK